MSEILNLEMTKYLLDYLANADDEHFEEGNSFEFMGETECGADGYFSEKLTRICESASQHIDQLQRQNDELVARIARLEKAALIAIHALPGGDKKAEVRDIYDESPKQSLAAVQVGVVRGFMDWKLKKMRNEAGEMTFMKPQWLKDAEEYLTKEVEEYANNLEGK